MSYYRGFEWLLFPQICLFEPLYLKDHNEANDIAKLTPPPPYLSVHLIFFHFHLVCVCVCKEGWRGWKGNW